MEYLVFGNFEYAVLITTYFELNLIAFKDGDI